jgi:predicted XRE-type DNA-binding protein/tetratricopeptide (TPR) repeat protein
MNAIEDGHGPVDPEEWERPEMRAALGMQDLTRVYRLLQKLGFSQQRIAGMVGQSQPEVSAIIHGRKVMAYDVLARVAEGLGIPRGYMGLSYNVESAQGSDGRPVGGVPSMTMDGTVADAGGGVQESGEDDPVQRRDFLGAVAAVALGAHPPAIQQWLPRPVGPLPAAPARVGAADIEQIRVSTHQLYELDRQLGGEAVLGAVSGHLRWASGLLRASCTEEIGRQLRVALADLNREAGLALLDSGRYREANRHFLQGLVLTRDLGDHEFAATLLWSMGRVSLHQEHATDALRFFQLGLIAAEDAGSHAEMARLYANEAWAYALVGKPRLVADAQSRADHEYGQVVGQGPFAFHGAAQQAATCPAAALEYRAAAHWMLARGEDRAAARSAELAVDLTTRVLAADDPQSLRTAARGLALDQTMHATGLLRLRERERGLAAAHAAVDRVAAIRSARATDRLRYLAEAANAWPRHPDAIHLRRRIAALQAA